MGEWATEFFAPGTVAGQGSKKYVGMSKAGHGILIEQSKRVAPWRSAVAAAFKRSGAKLIPGAIEAELTFVFARPKSAKRKYPSVAPDVDKAIRSTADALTQAGAYEDDARIVIIGASKIYVDAQNKVPGALIRLRAAA